MNKITSGTWARTIILALALINQVLAVKGYSTINIADDEVNLLVATVFSMATSIVSWWKNNSFSKKAREADGYLKKLREYGKAVEEV